MSHPDLSRTDAIIAALRAAEDHFRYCCSHCTGVSGDETAYKKVITALESLGQASAVEQERQKFLAEEAVFQAEQERQKFLDELDDLASERITELLNNPDEPK